MNRLLLNALTVALVVTSISETVAAADSPNNGDAVAAAQCLKAGDPVGAFYVTKIAGAKDDGVQPGQELCYRCRYGSRPMVIVFARKRNAKLVQLVKEIDSVIGDKEESQLRGLVAFMGKDVAEVKDNASTFAEQSGAHHVPVAIAKETETGPPNYRLDDSSVTVFMVKDSKLVSLHRCDAGRINVLALMRGVKQMLRSDRPSSGSSAL